MKPHWLARVFVTLASITLVLLGFFFLTVALVVGAVIALVIGVRFWWALRKIRRAQGHTASTNQATASRGETVVDGEYRVIEHASVTSRLTQHERPAAASPPAAPPAP